MNDLVSVIIPSCGRSDYFISCLESLFRQTCPPREVILINNSLSVALEQKARESYPSVKMITPDRNLYYGDSLNCGIAMSMGDFILCLNDDVVLDKNFIGEALQGFIKDEKIGMVTGKILRPDRKTLDSTGLFLSAYRTAQERGYGREDWGQFEGSGPVFGVSGAAAFYRKKMLNEVQEREVWFDPRFRMFYEDLDLAWRAHKRGWKGYYISSAVAYHVRGGSVRAEGSQGKTIARQYLNDEMYCCLIRNRYLTIIKNEDFRDFLFHLIPVALYELASWIHILFFRPKVAWLLFSQGMGRTLRTHRKNQGVLGG